MKEQDNVNIEDDRDERELYKIDGYKRGFEDLDDNEVGDYEQGTLRRCEVGELNDERRNEYMRRKMKEKFGFDVKFSCIWCAVSNFFKGDNAPTTDTEVHNAIDRKNGRKRLFGRKVNGVMETYEREWSD